VFNLNDTEQIKHIAYETLLQAYCNLEQQYSELIDKYKGLQEENVMLHNIILGCMYDEKDIFQLELKNADNTF